MNVPAVITDLENSWLISRALALFANQLDVSQELHLDRYGAIALADFAAPAGNVEGKMPRREATLLALRQGSEQLADGVERLNVGDGIGAWRATNRRLIDEYNLVDPVHPKHVVHFRLRPATDLPLLCSQGVVEHVVYQG